MWFKKKRLSLGLILAVLEALSLQACSGQKVQSNKTAGADLWNYHTYAWQAQASTPEQTDAANYAKERTDLELAKNGMIPVPFTGNPDVWIVQQTTPYDIAMEFRDAHTGKTYWKGKSQLESKNSSSPQQLDQVPTKKMINSAVDTLVDRYISDREWMSASFWWKGIDQVG